MNDKTLITAHAGCVNKDLDSLDYIIEALKHNVDIIELDVRFKDGVAILSHDEIYEDKKINTVKEALELIEKKDNVKVNFDIKEFGGVDILIDDIKNTNMLKRGLVTGVKLSKTEVDKLKLVGIECFLNIEYNLEVISKEDYFDSLTKEILELDFDGVNVDYNEISQDLVNRIHELDKRICVWTVDDLNEVNRMKTLNVDSITTNIIHLI